MGAVARRFKGPRRQAPPPSQTQVTLAAVTAGPARAMLAQAVGQTAHLRQLVFRHAEAQVAVDQHQQCLEVCTALVQTLEGPAELIVIAAGLTQGAGRRQGPLQLFHRWTG